MQTKSDFWDKYRELIYAYAIGLGILLFTLTCLVGWSYFGIPPLISYPYLNMTIQLLLWDPMLVVANLHALVMPCIAIVTAIAKRDWEGLEQYSYSLLSTLSLTFLTKHFVGRERPNGFNNSSFFSGHTASAFSGAAYIHHRYHLLAALPLYAIASGIACARVVKDWHHPSDVVAGAGVALLFSYNMIPKNKPNTTSSSDLPKEAPDAEHASPKIR